MGMFEVNSFGYDVFFGRQTFSHLNSENLVYLDFDGNTLTSYNNMNMVWRKLRYSIRNGKRILLYRSPGFIGTGFRRSFFETFTKNQLQKLHGNYMSDIELKLLPNPFIDLPEDEIKISL